MISRYDWPKVALIVALSVTISFLHYMTAIGEIYRHIFYRELYFLPLILGGFWFGLKGGLVTSVGITILYIPEIIMDWQGFSHDDFDKMLEVLLFNIVAPGIGYIRDRERTQENARLEAEHMAREEAESASRLKSDFLTMMSHELRTPLISIIGYNDLLLDGVAGSLNDEQIDALRKVDNNSKKLLGLINAILDFSRLEAESSELKDISVADLIKEIESDTVDLYMKSGLDFSWKAEPELPHIHSDRVKLKLALKNLIANAVKFTDAGSVTVDAHRRDEGIEIGVTDTGSGITPEDVSIIFEPFRQLENPLTRIHGGVGLGLYVVKRLVEILGGTIKVESEVGKGSTFSIWIPMKYIVVRE